MKVIAIVWVICLVALGGAALTYADAAFSRINHALAVLPGHGGTH